MPVSGLIGLTTLAFSGYQYLKSRNDKKKADAEFEKTTRNRGALQTPTSLTDVAADARGRLNAQNPALQAEQQAIQQQAAATAGYAQRNASSGTQALQAAADANAQTYAALPQLAQQDTAYRQQNLQNYYNTQQGLTEDARLKFGDALDANNTAAQIALGRVGAAQQDGSQALALGVQSLGSLAGSYGQYKNPGNIARTQRVAASQNFEQANPLSSLSPIGSSPIRSMPSMISPGSGLNFRQIPNYGLNSYLGNRLYQPYSFGNY